MNSLPAQTRESRRNRIVRFFSGHVGESFRSDYLHTEFGSAFRSRVSELNRDPSSAITVHNCVERLPDGAETSCYWATWNSPQGTLFPWFPCDQVRERHRDDG